MQKIVLLVLGVCAFAYIISCNKSTNGPSYTCTSVEPAKDSAALLKYAADSIIVTKDTTGMYFQILDSGAGQSPNGSSNLLVYYKARLLNNTIFDSTASPSNLGGLTLNQLIPGFQIGLEKIKKGGHIKMLIPSALAWGCLGSGSAIPVNAPVYFDVYLVDLN